MRRIGSYALSLLGGAVLLLVTFGAARTLLHDRALVYLLFPLISLTAWAAGLWRRAAAAESPGWGSRLVHLALLNAPLAVALCLLLSARDRGLFLLLGATVLASLLGLVASRRRRAALALFLGNAALAVALPAAVSFFVDSREVMEPAPDFVLHLVDGTAVRAADLRGRVVVVDVWATWCVPCRRELPEIDRLAKRLAAQPAGITGKPGPAFFAVDSALTDEPGAAGDTPELARRALADMGVVALPLAWSGDGALESALGLHGFPALVVIDPQGRIRFRHTGYQEAERLDDVLARRIEELQAGG